MRRIITLLAGALLALGLTAGPALAFEPPGNEPDDLFRCLDEDSNPITDPEDVDGLAPVRGHPGSAGLVDATPKVGGLTADTPASDGKRPTAWGAVDLDNPIAESCDDIG